jgi:hypothetical protein
VRWASTGRDGGAWCVLDGYEPERDFPEK